MRSDKYYEKQNFTSARLNPTAIFKLLMTDLYFTENRSGSKNKLIQ